MSSTDEQPSRETPNQYASPEVESAPSRKGGPLRRLYHWVMSWADTPYGTPALAVMSFAESSFFPIPPDVLQIALSVARPKRSFYYAAVSAVASVAGAAVGWLIGHLFWAATSEFFFDWMPGFSPEHFEHVGELYRDHAFLAICGAAFTPIPFKIFTIAAGVFSQYISLPMLLFGAAIGRTGRFMLVAAAVYFFGEPARRMLERHFEWLTALLFAMLAAGFLVLRWIR